MDNMGYFSPDFSLSLFKTYPKFDDNKTDKMVGELFTTSKSKEMKIESKHYLSSKDIREIGEMFITIANQIDKFNESEG